ncbi:MAG TPA: sigma 54-interacting transcriptional regulator [Thermodesulfobacteriota bacterium]|nr:sigma 54-interacting transcriptional regulator [Thermodesulfobacteriota bacterium]
MNVDENVFFREATLRICSSLDIEMALKRCFEYIGAFIPVIGTTLHTLDPDLNLMQLVASVGVNQVEGSKQVLPLPEKGRNKRTADLQAALLRNEVVIQVINQPDQEVGLPEILERLRLKSDISVMMMYLKLESSLIGMLGVAAGSLNKYTNEHARLLQLLHEPFAIAMSKALEHLEIIRLKDMLADDNRYLFDELRSALGDEIIGSDFGLKTVMEMVKQVASIDSPVLLLGETGTGKEVIANAIHYSSPRKDGPFIKVNCGAIPETLLDSELFGHEKGAFTGAISQKRGRFERANKGTIFLDEIGELPAQAQVRLLRVLQTKEIERVGGTTSIPVDIRIISATNRNLEEMIASGRFREDLWFRLNVFPIMIPPLRERRVDIPALVHHFIDRKTKELKLAERPVLNRGAIDRLVAYDWPGNVRELENLIERALIQYRGGGGLSFDALLAPQVPGGHEGIREAGRNRTLLSFDEMAVQHIRRALQLAGGKINGPGGAAQLLGLHPNTLRTRMNKLGIPFGRKSLK